MSLLPTIWPRRRAETGSFPILAETSDPFGPVEFLVRKPYEPADDPSYCCEACENLTARIRRARQAVLITQFLLPDLERELVELEAKHRDDLAQEMADLERRHP